MPERKTDDGASEPGRSPPTSSQGCARSSTVGGRPDPRGLPSRHRVRLRHTDGRPRARLRRAARHRGARLRLPAGRARSGWGHRRAAGQPPRFGPALAPTLLTGIALAALPMAVAVSSCTAPSSPLRSWSCPGRAALLVDVLTVTLLQRALPDELRGRVFGSARLGRSSSRSWPGRCIVSPLVDAPRALRAC